MSDTKLSTLEQPEVMAFFDAQTNTISYIVKEPGGNACAVIDSVMNMDYAAGRITFESADEIIQTIQDRGLELEWIIETHVHADHLSAAPYLQEKLGGKIGISEKIIEVQDTFGKIFNEGTAFQRDGSQFDALFEDGDKYQVGQLQATVIATPVIRQPVWYMSWVMRLSWETHCSCPMGARLAQISLVEMLEPYTIPSKKC